MGLPRLDWLLLATLAVVAAAFLLTLDRRLRVFDAWAARHWLLIFPVLGALAWIIHEASVRSEGQGDSRGRSACATWVPATPREKSRPVCKAQSRSQIMPMVSMALLASRVAIRRWSSLGQRGSSSKGPSRSHCQIATRDARAKGD